MPAVLGEEMNLTPPPLIDELLSKAEHFKSNQCEIGGYWYCARSLPYYSWRKAIRQIWHAWLVLTGKAMAFQFAEDRPKPPNA